MGKLAGDNVLRPEDNAERFGFPQKREAETRDHLVNERIFWVLSSVLPVGTAQVFRNRGWIVGEGFTLVAGDGIQGSGCRSVILAVAFSSTYFFLWKGRVGAAAAISLRAVALMHLAAV